MNEISNEDWSVYLVLCLDGSLYTGVTNDIEKRMLVHKSGKGSKYVRAKGFDRLLAVKYCADKVMAMKYEYFIKHLPRAEKINWFKL